MDEPYTIYIDQIADCDWYVQNLGATGLDIWNLYVEFDWGGGSYLLVGSTHVTIASGTDSPRYHLNVHIPQTLTAGSTHAVEMRFTAQQTGDLFSTAKSTWFNFDVHSVPTLVVASTGANPNSGTAPLTVYFNPNPSGGLEPYTYSWTFGDGGTSTSASPSHQYTAAGSFTATVVVTDTETTKQVKSATATITVTAAPLPDDDDVVPPVDDDDDVVGGTAGIPPIIIPIAIVAIIAVVAIIIAVMVMGKKKKAGGQGPAPPMQQSGPPQNP